MFNNAFIFFHPFILLTCRQLESSVAFITPQPSTKQILASSSLKERSSDQISGVDKGQGQDKGHEDDNSEILNLIPQDNPTISPNKKSISGVTYGDVLSGLNGIYPPEELSQRNAISRKDGYWTFIEDGLPPPSQYTYGEFDFLFFAELMDIANAHYHRGIDESGHDDNDEKKGWDGKTFVDIGSGAGRLVLGAAALHPNLQLCKGIEILPGIHQASLENMEKCKRPNSDVDVLIEESEGEEAGTGVEDGNTEQIDINGMVDSNYEYEEPLSDGMNEMQKALQEMTPEEWAAILGDFEFDDEDLELEDSDIDEDNDEDSFITSSEEEEEEEKDDDDELVEQEMNQAKIDQRQIEHIVLPSFTLPSDKDLILKVNIGDNDGNEGTSDDTEDEVLQFESIDDFLAMTKDQWIDIFGEKNELSPLPKNDIEELGSHDVTEDKKENKDEDKDEYALTIKGDDDQNILPLAPIRFVCGSFQDPYEYIGDADIVFIFSSCMTESMIGDLSDCIGRQCKPGTIVISTEFELSNAGDIAPLEDNQNMPYGTYKIELIENIEGFNWVTGTSTAFIHRVTKSLWNDSGPLIRPSLDPSQVASNTIRDMEAGNLTNTEKFMREVRNNMVFHSISNIIQTQLEIVSRNTTIIDEDNLLDATMSGDDDFA